MKISTERAMQIYAAMVDAAKASFADFVEQSTSELRAYGTEQNDLLDLSDVLDQGQNAIDHEVDDHVSRALDKMLTDGEREAIGRSDDLPGYLKSLMGQRLEEGALADE